MQSDNLLLLAVILALILIGWLVGHLLLRTTVPLLGWLIDKPGNKLWTLSIRPRNSLSGRFPKLYGWLERRFEPRVFTGLPLTLLIGLALYSAALLGGIVEDVIEADSIVEFDDAVNAFFTSFRSDLLVSIFNWITTLGGTETLVAVAIVSTGFFWSHRHLSYIPALWLVIVGSQIMTWVGKYGFDRARPEYLTSAVAYTPSFPSAHSAGSMAVYGFVAYAIARELRSKRRRFETAYVAAVLILLIGFSRIFLSVHYFSDVAAGFLVGIFWLLVGFALREYLHSRNAPHRANGG